MRKWILLSATALLLPACNKTEEKPAPAPAVTAPKSAPEKRLRSPATSAPATAPAATPGEVADLLPAGTPKAPPPTPQEMEALYADLDALVKSAEPLLKGDPETMPEADLASIQKSWSELMKRRLKLMAGMDPPQRQQTVDRFRPVMQINSALTTWRLKGMRDKLKAVQPPGVPESPPAVPDPGTAPVPAEPGTPPQ